MVIKIPECETSEKVSRYKDSSFKLTLGCTKLVATAISPCVLVALTQCATSR
jgi:hypothetical protein